MQAILLVILMIVTLAMIGVILLQRSEGGALGIGGGAGGGLMSARGTANLLSRTTTILAAIFMGLCLILGALAGHRERPESLLDEVSKAQAPVTAPAAPATAEQPKPATPTVPIGQ